MLVGALPFCILTKGSHMDLTHYTLRSGYAAILSVMLLLISAFLIAQLVLIFLNECADHSHAAAAVHRH